MWSPICLLEPTSEVGPEPVIDGCLMAYCGCSVRVLRGRIAVSYEWLLTTQSCPSRRSAIGQKLPVRNWRKLPELDA